MFYSIGTVSKWKQLFLLPALLIPLIGGSSIAEAVSIDSSWQKSSTRSSVTPTAQTTSGSKINTINDSNVLSSLRGHGYGGGQYANGSKFLTGKKRGESTYQYETSSNFSVGDYLYLGIWADNTSARVGDSASNVSIDLYYDDPSEIVSTINASGLASSQPSTIYENFPTSIAEGLDLQFNSAYVYSPVENSSNYQTVSSTNDSNNQKLSLNAGSITVNSNFNQYKNYIVIFEIVDTTAPTGSVSYSPDLSTDTNGSVTVTVTCSDSGGSGCAQSTYTKTVTENESGTITITDNAGNTADISYSVTNIDTTAPAGSVSYSPDLSIDTNSNVTVTVTCSDSGGSGCTDPLQNEWTYDSDNNSISQTFSENTSGSVTIADSAGNTADISYSVTNIDTTAPTGSVSYSPDLSIDTNSNVTVTVTCSDSGGSGCTDPLQNEWTYDSGNNSISQTFSENTSGSVTIADSAGNTADISYSVSNIDKTAPTAPTVSGVDGTLFNSSVTPSFSCSEGTLSTSGLDGWSNNTPISADGDYSLSGTCADPAGNVSDETNISFTIDTTAPTGYSASFDDPDDLINSDEQSGVSFSFADAEVDASYSYSINDSDDTTDPIIGSGVIDASDNQITAIDVSSLSDGDLTLTVSLTDPAGNVGTDVTDAIVKDTTAPTGYSASFDDPDDLINSDEQSGVSFSFADAEVDASYSYSINDSDDTTDPIIGSGVIDASDNQITAIDVSSLSDGDLTLTVSLTDPAGNVGTDVTDAIVKDTTAPTGYSASFDDPDDLINSDEQSGVSFSFADAEVDASYSYSINDSDDTTDPIIGSGVIDASDNQITAIDVSSLSDGDLTLTVSPNLTDPAGNVGTDVTDAIVKDTTAPTGYSASFDDPDDLINSDEQSGVSFSFADAEVDASYSYSINDSDDTTDPIIGSGVIDASDNQITAIDVSSLSDGDLTLTVSLTDPAGNVGTDVTDAIVKDTTAPTGYSASFDDPDDLINSDEQSGVSFSFADAEVDASYSYSINDSDDTTDPIIGSGVIDASDNQITAIDVSSLSDGDLTLTVSLTDPAGNVGTDVTDAIVKDTTAPTGYSASFDDPDDLINSDEQSGVSFSFADAEVDASYSYSINDSDDTTDPIIGSGVIDASDNQITAIDVSSLSDGDLTLTVSLTDPAGNVGVI